MSASTVAAEGSWLRRCARRAGVLLLCATLVNATFAQTQPAGQSGGERSADSSDASTQAIGQEAPWPRTVAAGGETLTVYQPQLDSWNGYTLRARMAVQAAANNAAAGADSPRTFYGVISVEAQTLTDKGRRVVTVDRAKLLKADFPAATPAQAQAWGQALAEDMERHSRTIALDRLEAALAANHAVQSDAAKPLRNAPPQIVFSAVPALLVYIDGQPVYKKFEGSAFERVINTRPLLLRDARSTHYLKVFDGWMSAPAAGGPWTVLAKPGADLDAAFEQAKRARSIDPLSGQTTPDQPAPTLAKTVPAIFVATAPTELVVTDGAPNYVPIADTHLLYVANSTGHIFKDIAANKTYVLTAGRWFRAPDERGPWEFVAADKLPADFARIPDDSAKENVKASVAGTAQAREATIAASIPQTAQIEIQGTAMSPPQIDGEPVYEPIAGTRLDYVTNTALPIIRVDAQSFYAVENGVWFFASSVRGPWRVATMVPAAIYTIPPESRLYYVTYVRIYAVAGNTVYEGYTSGYQGVVIDPVTGVVVYGTGYVYDPWIGTVWYGPPCTYGFGAAVAYTPWTGWAVAFGFGWAWGAATVAVGWGWGPYPWWGPWGWGWAWGPPVYPWYPAWGVARGAHGGAMAWGPGGWAGYSGNIYQNWGSHASVSRVAGGYNAWTGNAWSSRVGMAYNSRTGIAAAGQRGAVENVYTGNFAAGSRGVATGPGGNVVIGGRGIAGNAATGNVVAGDRGVVYNKNTGEVTHYGHVTGQGGTVAHYGDDIYAGKDGNVYRYSGNGNWEQHTAGGGWQPAAGSAEGAATRSASGGLGATHNATPAARSDNLQQLERENSARNLGGDRAQGLRDSSRGMHRSFGGFRRR